MIASFLLGANFEGCELASKRFYNFLFSGRSRVGQEDIDEVIIALNANIEGDTTSFYLARKLQPFKIKVSGRLKHYMNAFGEEVIVDNTDKAIAIAILPCVYF